MSDDLGNLRSIVWAWVMAGIVGAVAFVMLMVLGEFRFPAAAFIAALLVVLIGGVLTWALRPLPRFGDHARLGGGSALPKAPLTVSGPVAKIRPGSAAAMPGAAPVAAPAAAAAEAEGQGQRPQALDAPRGGQADDLKEIEGIGPVLEKLCHELGVFHFDQIADWGPAEVAWMDSNLRGFKGRVTRDKWVPQARIAVTEGLASLRERAKTNNY